MGTSTRLLAPAFAFAILAACGGSSGNGPSGSPLKDVVAMVSTQGGAMATLEAGAQPSAGGGPAASAANASAILPGGSAFFDVTGSASFDTVYVSVAGLDGHWRLGVPAGTARTLVLSVGQAAPSTFTLRFGVASGGVAGSVASVPVTLTSVGTGPIQVSLTWDTPSDVDLHLVEPGGQEIYYGSTASPSGGSLDLDSNPACSIDGVNNENITYAGATPPSGTYTVRVDYWDSCGVTSTNYIVTVTVKGAVSTYSGTLTGPGDQGGAGSGVTVATFTY